MQQNLPKSAQNCLKLPKIAKIAKICPKTISSRNFEIPPKIEILVIFQKKRTSMYRGDVKACAHRLDFQYKYFPYAFLNVKKRPFVCEFQHTSLCKMTFFS
jgi:hypothetical protein